MSIKYCYECGGTLSSAARRCPHCGGPGVPGHYRARTWLGALALLLVGGTAGWLLGPGPVGKVARTKEAIGDVALPLSQAVTDREREQVVRYELERYVRLQERFFLEHGRYQNLAEAPTDAGDFSMNYLDDGAGKFWLASMHLKERPGVYCAVAVGKRSYLEGIVLKRSGAVRCSRDLATRVNGFLLRVLPVRLTI